MKLITRGEPQRYKEIAQSPWSCFHAFLKSLQHHGRLFLSEDLDSISMLHSSLFAGRSSSDIPAIITLSVGRLYYILASDFSICSSNMEVLHRILYWQYRNMRMMVRAWGWWEEEGEPSKPSSTGEWCVVCLCVVLSEQVKAWTESKCVGGQQEDKPSPRYVRSYGR